MTTWGDLSEAQKQAVVHDFLASGRDYAIIERHGLQRTATIERRIREIAQHWVRLTPDATIPVSETPDYTQEVLRVYGDAVVIGDVEIPDHDASIIELAARVGKRAGIETLIINGDLIASDGLSKHLCGAASPRLKVQEELRQARQVIQALQHTFPDVYVVSGNHDKRARWQTSGQFTADFLLGDLPNVTTTPFSRLYLTSGGVDWMVCHPRQYRKAPGSLARDIAETEDINVVVAHTHLLSWSLTKDGRHVAIDGGHCRDAKRTMYKTEDVTTHPRWCAGLTVVRDGFGFALSKEYTDWRCWQ